MDGEPAPVVGALVLCRVEVMGGPEVEVVVMVEGRR